MRWGCRDLVDELCRHYSAHLVGPDVIVEGASFDSRDILPNQLFVPIVSQRDGHDFIAQALTKGAGAYLTSRPDLVGHLGGTAIVVPDTSRALIDAACWVRSGLTASTVVIGVTGSVGKTTTKDFIATVLATHKRVSANVRSFNNEQGLPVTILNAPVDTEVLVLEMGMRGFGQIADLCRIAQPSIGVVTRVGQAHTELLGGLRGVARAKGELIEALSAHGLAILNADDENVLAMGSLARSPVLLYGESARADIRIVDLILDSLGRARFTVVAPSGQCDIYLASPGRHMASNAAAALAVGEALGVPLPAMAESLANAELSEHRMQVRRTKTGVLLLDDCYNANPTSMAAALDTLGAIESEHRVAILGLMAEIDDAIGSHREMSERAHHLGIEILAVGTDLYGVQSVSLHDAILRVGSLSSTAAVLVKGSRVAGLENIVSALVD